MLNAKHSSVQPFSSAHESQAVTSNFRIPFPFKKSQRPRERIGNARNKHGELQDMLSPHELGRLKNVQFEFPREETHEEAGRNKRIHKSQHVPRRASQHLELQQWYETRLKNYDSNRLRDAFCSLLQLSHIPKSQLSKWLRPSVPDIEKFSYRSRRPYVGKYNVSRMKTNPAAPKIKLPPDSRQAVKAIGVGQLPLKSVKPAITAINHAHSVLTESATSQVEDDEYGEPTMVPYIPPAVYKKVTLIQQRYAPYTLAMRLSNGCSGILITPLHVVTSAHCVYPRTSSNHSLKVEVPESMGYRVHYVDGVYVPRGYRIAKGDGAKPNYAKAVHDYAVMTLNAPIPGRREFPRIASVDVHRLGSTEQIHIIGYPTNTYPQMWQSSCSFLDSRPALGGKFVTSSCASPRGMGGAAALLDNVRTRDDMKMIGIATNMVLNESSSIGDQQKSLVLLFTPNKVAEICQQIKPWDQGGCA